VSAGGGMKEGPFNQGGASPRSDRALTTITCRRVHRAGASDLAGASLSSIFDQARRLTHGLL
jgi:hypothetical protein